jgi:hypothetical protein
MDDVSSPPVLRDERGEAFEFLPVRAIRDGADVFLLAERPETGTLHVLKREGDVIGLVRDEEDLRRVSRRLEILRRAMDGELIEWRDEGGETRHLGVIDRGEADGTPYVLAADLEDPALVVALEPGPDGLREASERLVAAVHDRMQRLAAPADREGPNLEAATFGARRESLEITDDAGRTRTYRAAGRLVFEGRDLLFVETPDEPGRAVAVEVHDHGRLEPVADEAYLSRLRAHIEAASVSRAQAVPGPRP